MEDSLQIQNTINYIKGRIENLIDLKDKEIQRLAKYGEHIKVVVILKEKEFKTEYRNGHKIKRHLTWQEIADRAYCSPRSARSWYKLGIEERKRVH